MILYGMGKSVLWVMISRTGYTKHPQPATVFVMFSCGQCKHPPLIVKYQRSCSQDTSWYFVCLIPLLATGESHFLKSIWYQHNSLKQIPYLKFLFWPHSSCDTKLVEKARMVTLGPMLTWNVLFFSEKHHLSLTFQLVCQHFPTMPS